MNVLNPPEIAWRGRIWDACTCCVCVSDYSECNQYKGINGHSIHSKAPREIGQNYPQTYVPIPFNVRLLGKYDKTPYSLSTNCKRLHFGCTFIRTVCLFVQYCPNSSSLGLRSCDETTTFNSLGKHILRRTGL